MGSYSTDELASASFLRFLWYFVDSPLVFAEPPPEPSFTLSVLTAVADHESPTMHANVVSIEGTRSYPLPSCRLSVSR